jgi:prepilin-type N-terminal cleavage/methylation domain-containing protein
MHIAKRDRRGFTLVELLVVIAIIGVLVSLLLAAVMKAVAKAEEVQTRSDISQLAEGISAWGVKFEVQGPFPSRLLLCEDFSDYAKDGTQLATDSAAFLQRVWPRIVASGSTAWAAGKIDWSGSKNPTNKKFILQGQECLVFFLGGIPTGQGTNVPGCTGFSTSPTNPAAHVTPGGGSIIPPFFSFDSSRLRPGQARTLGLFYHYLDPYGKKPFAYFSSYKTQNGYNHYGSTDCPNIAAGTASDPVPWPYAEAGGNPGRYMNPNTFQIISAGRLGAFGSGTTNLATGPFFVKGTPMYAFGQPGYDNMSNFHDKFLGIPND